MCHCSDGWIPSFILVMNAVGRSDGMAATQDLATLHVVASTTTAIIAKALTTTSRTHTSSYLKAIINQ